MDILNEIESIEIKQRGVVGFYDTKISSSEEDCILVGNYIKNQSEINFKKIYDKYYRSLLFLCRGKYFSGYDAADVVNIGIIKAMLNISMYDNKKGVFSTWLYNVVKNTIIDHIRNELKKRNKNVSIDELVKDSSGEEHIRVDYGFNLSDRVESGFMKNVSSFSNAETLLIEKERREFVLENINKLKSKSNSKILLMRLKGMKMKEISKKTGLSMQIIKSRILRGKLELKEIFSEELHREIFNF
jgi:RNA polymerase sigma-70 factor (ECF subfamily)